MSPQTNGSAANSSLPAAYNQQQQQSPLNSSISPQSSNLRVLRMPSQTSPPEASSSPRILPGGNGSSPGLIPQDNSLNSSVRSNERQVITPPVKKERTPNSSSNGGHRVSSSSSSSLSSSKNSRSNSSSRIAGDVVDRPGRVPSSSVPVTPENDLDASQDEIAAAEGSVDEFTRVSSSSCASSPSSSSSCPNLNTLVALSICDADATTTTIGYSAATNVSTTNLHHHYQQHHHQQHQQRGGHRHRQHLWKILVCRCSSCSVSIVLLL